MRKSEMRRLFSSWGVTLMGILRAGSFPDAAEMLLDWEKKPRGSFRKLPELAKLAGELPVMMSLASSPKSGWRGCPCSRKFNT